MKLVQTSYEQHIPATIIRWAEAEKWRRPNNCEMAYSSISWPCCKDESHALLETPESWRSQLISFSRCCRFQTNSVRISYILSCFIFYRMFLGRNNDSISKINSSWHCWAFFYHVTCLSNTKVVKMTKCFIQNFKFRAGFLWYFSDQIQVPTIENRVPRMRENYHRSLESERIGS